MNPTDVAGNRKLNREKAALNASVDNLVNSIKSVLNGNQDKYKDIQDSLNDFNLYSNVLLEELRKQNKYKTY